MTGTVVGGLPRVIEAEFSFVFIALTFKRQDR
jgi:hypothetical protein